MDLALIEEYKEFLCYFCYLSAFLEDVKFKVEKGEAISEEEMNFRLTDMAIAKKELLERKEKLGITGGLDFMENVNFQGFQYVNGELSGDYENLEKILLPWVEKFDIKNPYKYEVGVLLLSHYMRQKGLDEVKKRKSRRGGFFGIIKTLFGKLKRILFREKAFDSITFVKNGGEVLFELLE